MPRRPRAYLPDGIFHVTARGVARSRIFVDDDDRRRFLRLLAKTVERRGWCCHALCLMENHYHVVVEATRHNLSAGLHALNGRYAQLFNARHDRVGHLFGDRFWSSLLESEEHLQEACRYVLDSPVRAGLCARRDGWPWAASRYGASTS